MQKYLVFPCVDRDHFCMYFFILRIFSVITNIEYMVRTAETTMGITVFFDENLTEDEIKDIGAEIESEKSGIIKEIKFVSAEEAWDSFKSRVFRGRRKRWRKDLRTIILLAGSSSYEIRLNRHHGSGRDGGIPGRTFRCPEGKLFQQCGNGTGEL